MKSFKFSGNPRHSITISTGNQKIGPIPSTSFPRVITCNPSAPCTKRGCYMSSREGLRPTMIRAYQKNLNIYNSSPALYWKQLDHFLTLKHPRHFRYFVDGDIPHPAYLFGMIQIAKDYPDTIFTAYTKRYSFIVNHVKRYQGFPKNLIMLISAWPGFPFPKFFKDNFYRVVWMQNGKENRHPNNAIECQGDCQKCMACYDPCEYKDIVIRLHR